MSAGPARGQLRLHAAVRQGRTVLTDAYRTAPFHPAPVRYRDGRAVVTLQDAGPGILPGDRLHATVTVDRGAELVVEAQGAARVYPSPHGLVAEAKTDLTVADGGTLWWLPGVMIPYRAARYESHVQVRLEPGARFALLDVLTPGRVAMGERDAFARLDLRTRIDVGGKPAFIDRALLDPVNRPAPSVGERDDSRCFGALTLVGYELPAAAIPDPSDVWLGADGDARLAIVRGVSRSAARLRDIMLWLLERLETERRGADRRERRPEAVDYRQRVDGAGVRRSARGIAV